MFSFAKKLSLFPPLRDFRRTLQSIRTQFESIGGGSVDLTLDDHSGVATITLTNSERRNGISGRMMAQLSEVIHELSVWHNVSLTPSVGPPILNSYFREKQFSSADPITSSAPAVT